ncbi:MAG: hypothetical protein P8180_13120 [Gammaproteobacteria bacterium]|jgi:hypothetical protein
MTSPNPSQSVTHSISGRSARFASLLFNYGNIAALLIPFPIGLFWLGASMLVYAMNRHHPNEKVGHYTQQAAYRFYGLTGFFVAAATFIPHGRHHYYLIAWALGVLVLVPWSVIDILRIRRDQWQDMEVTVEEPVDA